MVYGTGAEEKFIVYNHVGDDGVSRSSLASEPTWAKNRLGHHPIVPVDDWVLCQLWVGGVSPSRMMTDRMHLDQKY